MRFGDGRWGAGGLGKDGGGLGKDGGGAGKDGGGAGKGNKYHACESGGYASRRERRRAVALRLMERQGLISGLREQVRYELIPAQLDAGGRTVERACWYVADFVYVDSDGRTVVEDAKGVRTKEYVIKRKLMLAVHGIRIREV